MVLKGLILTVFESPERLNLTVSTLRGCGSLESTDLIISNLQRLQVLKEG